MSLTYKGLTATYETVPVTEEEIDRQIERLRQATPAIHVITNRAAQLGDEVLLDYKGFCGGVQFEGGSADGQTLTLGSGTFIPGFEEQLLGKNTEEPVTVEVTFPTDYPHDELAGKLAEFRCVIHEIRVKTVYDLDDTFAKEVGNCETYAQMRASVGESLRQYYADQAEMELQDRLIRQVADSLNMTPSDAAVNDAVESQMQTLSAQLGSRGLNLDAYCRFTGKTEEQIREELRPEAVQAVKIQTAIEQIAVLEHVEAEQQEIADTYADICARNHITMETLQNARDEAFDEAVARSVITRKVLKLLRDSAQIMKK